MFNFSHFVLKCRSLGHSAEIAQILACHYEKRSDSALKMLQLFAGHKGQICHGSDFHFGISIYAL